MLDKIKGILASPDETYEFKHFVSKSLEITSLDIEVLNRNVIVKRSNIERLEIKYYTCEKDRIIITEDNETIKVANKTINKILNFINYNNAQTQNIEIFLPESLILKLKIRTTNGKMDLEKLNLLKSVDISTTNGAISISDLIVHDSLIGSTTNGSIKGSNLNAALIKFSSTNGSIGLNGVHADNLVVSTTNGSITVDLSDSIENYNITARTNNGKIKYLDYTSKSFNNNPLASNLVTLTTTNGNINISSK